MKRVQLPLEGRNRGVARIHASNFEHRGMGILVSPRLVVTCAHVVNYALDRNADAQYPPPESARVVVTFPLTRQATRRFQAREVDIRTKNNAVALASGEVIFDSAAADIAVLELDEDAPGAAGVAIIADIQNAPLDDDALSSYGFAGQLQFGHHVHSRFMGPAISGITQMNGGTPPAAFIERGYSGAAVWSLQHEVVIGMVNARLVDESGGSRIAYMIPAFALKEASSQLPTEVHTIPRDFELIWTTLSIGWLLLLLNHFLITQGGSPAPDLSLSGDHPQLAAFAGMHLFAFGAPVLYWMLRVQAKTRSLHDWSWRVPGFAFVRTRTVNRYRTALSALVLIILSVFPLYAQGHFLRKFHEQGAVFAYARDFGHVVTDKSKCLPGADDNKLCALDGAGRYSLAPVRNGAEGGYWKNRYRYGEDRNGSRDTVTFFPILQPIILEVLTLLALLLLVSALNRVFGRGIS